MDRLTFWNERANKGEAAGTDDVVLKRLEMKIINERIADGSSVLDVGCGNGGTLAALVREKRCYGTGVDFSAEMIRAAQAENLPGVSFMVGKAPGLPKQLGAFDYVLTERALINLDTLEEQHLAFLDIMEHVKPGGFYLMIECSNQGNEKTNALREHFGLAPLKAPWHNRFFNESEVENWHSGRNQLMEMVPFESTYHFLSRVVNAKLAKDQGIKDTDLKYESPLNLIALDLPIIGDFGPVRLWVWKRMA